LWEAETKVGEKQPAPSTYDQDDRAVKMQRFNGVSLGLDIKSN